MTKPWWKSKLIWFNAIIAAGAAAETSLHLIADYFDPRVYFGIIMAVSAVNVVLRLATTTGVTK